MLVSNAQRWALIFYQVVLPFDFLGQSIMNPLTTLESRKWDCPCLGGMKVVGIELGRKETI